MVDASAAGADPAVHAPNTAVDPVDESDPVITIGDGQNPPDEENPVKPSHLPEGTNFTSPRHGAIAKFLHDAHISGRLGSGEAETDPDAHGMIATILKTLPLPLLIVQTIWSGAVLAIGYALRPENGTSLSVEYWTSRLNVSSSIAYGVGWALFVLLGFFIREASQRYNEAQTAFEGSIQQIRQLVRQIRQGYPVGSWHSGDHERIMSHLVAYPIALKMTLRGERERAQLEHILHPDDLTDVLSAELMYVHCMRVVRSYITVAEDDATAYFSKTCAAEKTYAGWSTRFLILYLVDYADKAANSVVRIAHFRPSLGYLNHLKIFLYIWSFFLPLVLVKTSGWFTVLWSVIITYCVGMLFYIATALNHPFGYDLQDIRINRNAAKFAHDILLDFTVAKSDLKQSILVDHETPTWLESQPHGLEDLNTKKGSPLSRFGHSVKSHVNGVSSPFVLLSLASFLAWVAFIVFLTWGLADERNPGDRWWSIYLPLSPGTVEFFSLGVFLLLGFWMNDAYSRYWRSLQIWDTSLRPGIDAMGMLMTTLFKRGHWHNRDRERLLSYFVALAYCIKQHLRSSRDVSELEGILDDRDLKILSEAPSLPGHCLNVLHAYLNSADCKDPETCASKELPLNFSIYTYSFKLWSMEFDITACDSMRKYKISKSFTYHLYFFVIIWLLCYPIASVSHNGFLAFVWLTPIGYAVINLLSIGEALSDPFGYDEEDIPLDDICNYVKYRIHHLYHETLEGPQKYIREEEYDRRCFLPGAVRKALQSKSSIDDATSAAEDNGKGSRTGLFSKLRLPWKGKSEGQAEETKGEKGMTQSALGEDELTLKMIWDSVMDQLPSVPLLSMAIVIVWTVAVVFGSWGLSKISSWKGDRQDNCREWCSPIDVSGSELGNIGYALFLLLSFRASDAIGRYEGGAEMVYELKEQLRSITVDFMYITKQGLYHEHDRERFLAHIAQLPLYLRDWLLTGENCERVSNDSLLNENDKRRLADSRDPVEHIVRTIESYLLFLDRSDRSPITTNNDPVPFVVVYNMLERTLQVRHTVARIKAVKKYPVIARYSSHQKLFTMLWLGLLPLYMTSQTGFYTILWSPIVSYGVLSLQVIAEALVDPFGTDSIDMPVAKLMEETSADAVMAAASIQWDSYAHSRASVVDSRPGLGAKVGEGVVEQRRQFAHFEEHEATVENFRTDSSVVEFKSSIQSKPKPSLLVHMVRSVPWWMLLGVVAWATLVCILSYITRDKDVKNVRWWNSAVYVGTDVATYVSFAAFMLLGFYVQAAFKRYQQAGAVWGDHLRASCHSLTVQMMNMIPEGELHVNDHDRMVGHIAVLPLVLKRELRWSRDLRELKGLLSMQDIGRIQSAQSMTTHCLDVIRAYLAEVQGHSERIENWKCKGDQVFGMIAIELMALEDALRSAKFLNEFEIAPGFLILLNTLLGIWFLILPFVLVGTSGWFSILWISIVAYGVLGMYSIAAELQSPFGMDVNDLDLDKLADNIVADTLYVKKHNKAGLSALVRPAGDVTLWKKETELEKRRVSLYIEEEKPFFQRVMEGVKLAVGAVPLWLMVLTTAWAGASVALAYGTSKWFELAEGVCDSAWFCTYIAVDGSLKSYIGFALFLLLGFRLYDSHYRYVYGLRIWQDEVMGMSRLISNRFLESYPSGSWHENDVERFCGHLAAFSICLVGSLRGEDYADRLSEVLSDEDVQRVLAGKERVDYCIDVMRGYIRHMDKVAVEDGDMHPAGTHVIAILYRQIRGLSHAAYECRRIVRIPLPFGYVQHLRIFLGIYLMLLPLSLVEATGWLTILWIVFIAYGVLGIENWSEELADPFGYDVSDVPLDEICARIVGEIKGNLELFREGGVTNLVLPERV